MIEIRSAAATDIPLLRDLARHVWTTSYREMLTAEQIEYMLGWMYSEDALRRDLVAGILYDVIEHAGQPIGYAAYGPDSAAEWKLHKLYLLPEHQGRGFAQCALRRVCEVAARQEARSLALHVNKQNARAIRSYERAGFRIAEAVVNDIGGGFVMDDFVMRRDLT